jgi:flavin reductase (DIM6/NTAB) family NADH-FMN oxidoreductase RutF
MRFVMNDLTPSKQYSLMTQTVVPRPVAFVSTVGTDGVLNLAPFSFFNAIGSDPPTLGFSVGRRAEGRKKDTLVNIEEHPEFVVNLMSDSWAPQVAAAAAELSPEVDEFTFAGLTATPSAVVRPPRVAEAAVSLECRLVQIVPVGKKTEFIIGEILVMEIKDEIWDGERVDPMRYKPLIRLGGPTFGRLKDWFTQVPPKPPEHQRAVPRRK